MSSFDPAFIGLLPHPPIIVPAVGRGHAAACKSTSAACRDFARRMVAARPDRLFLVSPHAPRKAGAFGLCSGTDLVGDLAEFGVPEVLCELPNDRELVAGIERAAAELGIGTRLLPPQPLDHGSVVPLFFLTEAGWDGPTCIAALPGNADAATLAGFGRAVGKALAELPGRAALIASGDMTHRAKPGAPAGYDERALEFDRALTRIVADGQLERIPEIDPALRALAAEDAADSSIVIAAVNDFRSHGAEVLSYEHPFGVGYLVAVFDDGGRRS